MIGFIQGELIEYSEGRSLVAVGDRKTSGCVGYQIAVPHRSTSQYQIQQKVEFYVYSHVREDAFDLYGFENQFEKELFLTLLGVNGVGPKSALGILSSVEPNQLIDAILRADQAFLTGISGIGKKTAERIVVELKDTLRKKIDLGLLQPIGKRGVKNSSGTVEIPARFENQVSIFNDARSALVGLGYKDQDVHSLLNQLLESAETPPKRAEDLVRSALRQLV